MKNSKPIIVLAGVCSFLASACSDSESDTILNYGVSPEYSVTKSALEAWCDVKVRKNGHDTMVQFETDYVPGVACCELTSAANSDEAMRVQAIIGRTYAYAVLKWRTSDPYLDDSTNDQVYSCDYFSKTASPEIWEKCVQGAKDTSGLVVYRNGNLIATYYRSGCPSDYLDDDCVYRGSKPGCSEHGIETEGKITHNWGKSGNEVQTLYSGDPAGCLSHNGTMCLSKKGWVSQNILKFFYGMDIELRQAEGSCIEVQKCETQIDGPETILDESDKCFTRKISDNYFTMGRRVSTSSESVGYNDSLQFAYTTDKEASATGTWRVNVKTPGNYQVFAHVDSRAGNLSKKAVYEVRADSKESKITIDLNSANPWVEIGKFKFAAGEDQWVKLTDATGEAYTNGNGTRVVFDALKFVAAENCTDQCPSAGAKECHDAGYRTCGDSNGDGCLEWFDDIACNKNEVCQDGNCVVPPVSCTDECEADAVECSDNNSGIRYCFGPDEDGCLKWSDVEPCNSGLFCEDGKCIEKKSDTTGMPNACLTEVDGKETIIDELDACFVQSDSSNWLSLNNSGYEEHLDYAKVRTDKPSAVGTWYLNVTESGKYRIAAYISGKIGNVKPETEYTVKAGNRIYHPTISVSDETEGWTELGVYELKKGDLQYVKLTDETDNADEVENELRVVFDAIRIQPEGSETVDEDSASVNVSSTNCSVGSNSQHTAGLWMMMTCFAGLMLFRRRKLIP